MRLAVFADIHGNLTALEAVLQDLNDVGGADLTWCLGDLAGFGPRPSECIQRIKALAEADEGKHFKVIGGNVDRYMVNGERLRTHSVKDEESFKKLAVDWQARDSALNWGVSQLSYADYEFLKKIRGHELAHHVEGYGYVIGYHAVPGDDELQLTPETTEEESRDFLLDREGHLAIGGHIHRQFDRELGNWRVVNVGSVGMPFDVKGQAAWALFTFEEKNVTVDLRRVPFDVNAFIAEFDAVGYPSTEWAVNRGGVRLENNMPKREKLLTELQAEKDYGIFLAAQMGGVPNELQLIIQTAQLDEEKQGLRPRSQFVIRALGIAEHRMSLGIFGRLFFADEHPILYHHNEPRQEVHFEGKPKDVNELVLDIHQAYVTTFGPWRELASDINREKPLVDLLSSGSGVLGIMPKPAAERMVKVLKHHGMAVHLQEQNGVEPDEHGRSHMRKLLGIDDSYFVALDFSVEEMGKI